MFDEEEKSRFILEFLLKSCTPSFIENVREYLVCHITEREELFVQTNGNTPYFKTFYYTDADREGYRQYIANFFAYINTAVNQKGIQSVFEDPNNLAENIAYTRYITEFRTYQEILDILQVPSYEAYPIRKLSEDSPE